MAVIRLCPAERLVAAADRGEALLTKLTRHPAPAAARKTGLSFGLALAWRGVAALLGIGLATVLATALSVHRGEEHRIATLVEIRSDQNGGRTVRDVSRAPQPAVQEGTLSTVIDPRPSFAVDSSLLAGEAQIAVRRSADGALRVERIAYAGFGQDAAHLAVRLTAAAQPLADQPFAIAIMRATAEAGLSVQRAGLASPLATRFGSADAAEISLSDGERSRPCLGFRQRLPDGAGDLDGWWCPQGAPPERRDLACLIDRMTAAAGANQAIAAALGKPGAACGPARIAATPRQTAAAEQRQPPRR